LQNFIIFLLDQFLDGLESLVSLLHAEKSLLPIFKQRLLAHNDLLNLDGRLFESVSRSSCLLLLRDKLRLVEGFLLVQTLDLLVHGVDQEILLFLGLFQVYNVFLSSVGGATSDRDLGLHNFIVLLNLFECAVQLIELLLRLKYTLKLFVGLLFAGFILFLKNFELFFGIHTVLLDNIVVVVSALESGLHLCELMLHAVQLHTDLLSLLLDFPDLFLLLSEFEVDPLVLIRQLLCQGVLKSLHEGL
jgi:hypothetical protein